MDILIPISYPINEPKYCCTHFYKQTFLQKYVCVFVPQEVMLYHEMKGDALGKIAITLLDIFSP